MNHDGVWVYLFVSLNGRLFKLYWCWALLAGGEVLVVAGSWGVVGDGSSWVVWAGQ